MERLEISRIERKCPVCIDTKHNTIVKGELVGNFYPKCKPGHSPFRIGRLTTTKRRICFYCIKKALIFSLLPKHKRIKEYVEEMRKDAQLLGNKVNDKELINYAKINIIEISTEKKQRYTQMLKQCDDWESRIENKKLLILKNLS